MLFTVSVLCYFYVISGVVTQLRLAAAGPRNISVTNSGSCVERTPVRRQRRGRPPRSLGLRGQPAPSRVHATGGCVQRISAHMTGLQRGELTSLRTVLGCHLCFRILNQPSTFQPNDCRFRCKSSNTITCWTSPHLISSAQRYQVTLYRLKSTTIQPIDA